MEINLELKIISLKCVIKLATEIKIKKLKWNRNRNNPEIILNFNGKNR